MAFNFTLKIFHDKQCVVVIVKKKIKKIENYGESTSLGEKNILHRG